MLDRIRVVLVETSHPGNIGGAARAMKTMGLSRLVLVRPRSYPCAEATARASGADDLLARAEVVDSLEQALAGCAWVVGASARLRSLPVPVLAPRDFGERAVAEAAREGEIALLFGCESSGLNNAELDRCHALVQIPSNPDYSSLNLAAAVQVLSYELRVAAGTGGIPGKGDAAERLPASAEDMERFYAHLEAVLIELEFLDPENPRQLMRRLRRLYQRARPDPVELSILRGMLSAAQEAVKGR